jgi:cyclopropane-fatty-acyl-phospholipid synthase
MTEPAPSPARDDGDAVSRAARRLVLRALAGVEGGTLADGLEAELTVHRPRFYRRVLFGGGLGAAAAYLDGDWDSPDLTALLRLMIRARAAADALDGGAARLGRALGWAGHLLRPNTRRGARRNVHDHYDLGNDFFARMLDPSMTYSCGVFERPAMSLEEAQLAKYARLCRMLALQPDDEVIEIGSGWGGFALYAARHHGCHVTSTTISRAQHEEAEARVREAGLEDRVSILQKDYRDLEGRFDKLVSIEMIEAVGSAHLGRFLACCSSLLRPTGRAALQAITIAEQEYPRYRRSVDFIQRYVFPGSCILSTAALADAVARHSDLRLAQLEDIGPHYARTLAHWRAHVHAQREAIRGAGRPERFLRLWDYYLSYCEAGFAERYLGDMQLLLRKPEATAEDPLPQREGRPVAALEAPGSFAEKSGLKDGMF